MIKNTKKEKKKLVLWICLLFTLGLGLGYAVLTEQLKFNGTLNYDSMKWNVGFTETKDGGGSVTSVSSISSDKKTISITCDLGTSTNSETCITKATITNDSTFNVELSEDPTVTKDDTYIKSVSVNWSDSSTVKTADFIGIDESKEVTIKIITNELSEDLLPEDELSIPVTITMNWIESTTEYEDLLKGKVVSILGDSMSTLKGYIPEGNRARYVQTEAEAVDGLLYMPYEKTWWGGLIEELDMELGINDSWAGSRVSNTSTTDTGDVGPNTAISSMTRLQKLDDNGTPDIIFFYGGANDIGTNVTLGTFNPNLQLDTTSIIIDNFADAYAMTILRLKHLYPDSQIVALLPVYSKTYFTNEKLTQYRSVMREILDYYDVKYIDLLKSGVTTNDLADDSHLNEYGMSLLTQYIIKELNSTVQNSELVNLYETAELFDQYYDASGQLVYAYGGVSTMLDVKPGDKVISNSMGSMVMNGSSVDGSRMSYFSNDTFELTYSPADVFSTFKKTGYMLVPNDVNRMNVTFPITSHTNYLYVVDVENLYGTTEVYDKYYDGSGNWGGTVSGVGSMIVDVEPGDKIMANSFGDRTMNNSTSQSDSTRISYLENGEWKYSLSNLFVFEEYLTYGYITVPEGVDQINITWWTQSDDNYLYIIK